MKLARWMVTFLWSGLLWLLLVCLMNMVVAGPGPEPPVRLLQLLAAGLATLTASVLSRPKRFPYELLILATGAAFCVAIVVPGFLRARAQGQLTACKSNLHDVGTAMEKYFYDHDHRYPADLASLTPTYMQSLPSCLSARADSYSVGYHQRDTAYTLCCSGLNHQGAGLSAPGYPRVGSGTGLVERP